MAEVCREDFLVWYLPPFAGSKGEPLLLGFCLVGWVWFWLFVCVGFLVFDFICLVFSDCFSPKERKGGCKGTDSWDGV